MEGEYRDRTASLLVFGIVEILGGLLCALLAATMIVPLVISPNEMSLQQVLMGMSVYVFLAVWLICMATGTIRIRRWARVLMLAASWLMLVCGILAMGMMFFILPKCYSSVDMPDEIAKVVLIGTYIFMAVIYLLFPAVGVLFHGNRNVRATFEHHDSVPSWTEQCPLPVLVLVLMLAMATVSVLMMVFMNFAIPFFGTIVAGWKGAIILVSCVFVLISLAFGVYRLRPLAWWGVLALFSLGVASQLITFSRIELISYYEAMGYSEQMLEQMRAMNWMEGSLLGAIAAIYAVPGFIYLLLIKRYFEKPNRGEGDG